MERTGAQEAAPSRPSASRSDANEPVSAQAHVIELQRAAGNRAVAQLVARASGATARKTRARTVRAGDRLHVVTATGSVRNYFSGDFNVRQDGRLEFGLGTGAISVPVAGLTLDQTAQALARCLVYRELFVAPTVSVTLDGATASATYRRPKSAAELDRERYMVYTAAAERSDPALERYNEFVEDPLHAYELTKLTPARLWGIAQIDRDKPSPRQAMMERTVAFIRARREEDAREKDPAERARRLEAMTRFLDWVDEHIDTPGFLKTSPPTVYANIHVSIIKRGVTKEVTGREEARKHPPDAATVEERSAKVKEFMDLADQLYLLARRARQSHLKEFDKDRGILFLGDKVTADIYTDLAQLLLRWAFDHMAEHGFTARDAKAVFDELKSSGDFPARIRTAQSAPEPHEYYDDRSKDVSAGGTLASFGKAVFHGLTVIAAVGAFVGAEVLTAGQATWLLAAWAAKGGAESYMARRDEIEASGYDVPVLDTLVVSAGDIVGVSQIIEGISGERLLTGAELSGAERDEAIGGGVGGTVSIVMGSRAWKTGEAVGTRFREAEPTGAAVRPQPGPREKAARAQLPKKLVAGFDLWMERIRATKGLAPEMVLQGKPIVAIEQSSASFARAHAHAVARVKAAAFTRAHRAFVFDEVAGEAVWMHYDTTPPSAREIAHANRVARETGEPVHVFSDGMGEATIGEPGRALYLSEGTVAQARGLAQDALANAKAAGESMAEVHIDVPTATRAEIEQAWTAGPAELRGPVYEGKTIAAVIVRGRDGNWQAPTFDKSVTKPKAGQGGGGGAPGKRPPPAKKPGSAGDGDRVPVSDKPDKPRLKDTDDEGPTGPKGKAPAQPVRTSSKDARVAAETERLLSAIREKRSTLTRVKTELRLLNKRSRRTLAQRAAIDAERAELVKEAHKLIDDRNALEVQLEKVTITPYDRARGYSYSEAAEAAVIERATVVDQVDKRVKLIDEYSGKEIENPSIEHVVSIYEMSRMEGFDQLSLKDRNEVLSRLDNLRMMEHDLNSSKGSLRWEDWRNGLRRYGDKVWEAMVPLERSLRVKIAKDIKDRAANRPAAKASK